MVRETKSTTLRSGEQNAKRRADVTQFVYNVSSDVRKPFYQSKSKLGKAANEMMRKVEDKTLKAAAKAQKNYGKYVGFDKASDNAQKNYRAYKKLTSKK